MCINTAKVPLVQTCVSTRSSCRCVLVWMCARSTRVTQEAARPVMSYIDFRAAVECLFHSDIIRTEKLYKIAVVF